MKTSSTIAGNENGATIVYVAVILAVLMMFTALAVDVGYLYGVRNELQDGADAGALAGASVLFDSDGSLNRNAALEEGARVAEANKTGNLQITEKTVETGHWSFTTRTFTASTATEQVSWQERSAADLDLDPAFINAVRVRTDRSNTPSFFSKILGYDSYFVSTDAVAYIGFAGTVFPNEFDRPIAICENAIRINGAYSCNMGRMLNEGNNANTAETAMWTNFTQDPCSTASSSQMQGLTRDCAAGNPTKLDFNEGIGVQNGVQDNIFGNVFDCWVDATDTDSDGKPDILWPLKLPVVRCDESNTCAPLVGAVEVFVVWMIHQNDPHMNDVPLKMADWTCQSFPAPTIKSERLSCWKEFIDHFKIRNVNGPPVSDADYEEMYQKKNLLFLPSCEEHEPTGNTGGENFGILARIPKLVE